MEWKHSAAALLLLSLTACGDTNADASQTQSEQQQPETVAMPVETEVAQQGSISHFYQTTALLEAPQEAQVIARVSGMVERLLVEEGDQVKSGQPLAQIDPKHYQLALTKAQAELDVIDQELERMQKIANKQLVSDEQMARLSFRRQSALADRDLAQLKLQYSQVASPIDGVIAKRMIDSGNMATEMSTALFHVVQQQQLHAVLHLPEQQLANIALGQQAKLDIDGLSQSFPANVLRIAPVVDSSSGTVKVTLTVDNNQQQLRSGMLAKAKLQFDTHHNATIIGRNALLRQDNGHALFVVNDNKAQIRNVELGYNDDGKVEITAGLAPGDMVVIRGQHQLKDDTLVEVVNPLQLAAKE